MFKAIKIETEAEGASPDEIRFLSEKASSMGLPAFLKIGGVEARADIALAQRLGISGLIAPMVESGFGVEKFLSSSSGLGFEWLALTIESRTAIKNLTEILDAAAGQISGITVGRGDLAASLGLSGKEDSVDLVSITANTTSLVREAGFFATVGGNLLPSSTAALQRHGVVHDFLETRRFVIVSNPIENGWEGATSEKIRQAIMLEINLTESYSRRFEVALARALARREILEERLAK